MLAVVSTTLGEPACPIDTPGVSLHLKDPAPGSPFPRTFMDIRYLKSSTQGEIAYQLELLEYICRRQAGSKST